MRPPRLAVVVGLAAALICAGPAAAQPPAPSAVLFDAPNFHGHSVRISGGMSDLRRWGFARRAMSGHFDGDWIVCEGPRFTGRCVTLIGDLADLVPQGLDRRISSLRQADPGQPAQNDAPPSAPPPPSDADDGYFDRGRAPAPAEPPETAPAQALPPPSAAPIDHGVAGHSSVFFIRPQRGGADITGEGRSATDSFCRDQGLGPVLYYDTDGHVLRDVLCRRD
jgi:hypothetical protein